VSRSAVLVQRLLLLAAFLAAWQTAGGGFIPGVRWVDPFYISSPSRIAADLREGFTRGTLLRDLVTTLEESFAGLAVGTLSGVACGLAFAFSPWLEQVGEPFVAVANSLPRPALAPIAIFWFGLGLASKVFLAWSLVFFLVFYNTYLGVKTVDPDVLRAIRVMRATRWQLMRIVILPSVFSWIFAALRLAVSYALIGAIVGEFIGSTQGLGYQMVQAEGTLNTDRLYSTLVLIGIVAGLLVWLAKAVEGRVLHWRPPIVI
jgi:NitT/TauT family transport system permease protein